MITLCVKPTWKFYIGIIFTCTLFYLHVECMDSIGDQCKRKCDKEVAKDTDDLFCNIDCKRCQCYWGCDNYEKAVNSTCQRLCGDQHATQDGCTITTRPLQKTERQFCNLGCRSALESYTKFMEDAMKPLRAPELKTGQKSHSFVVLRWEGSLLPNVTHYLQARLIDVNGNWNINSALWDMTSGDINVTDLQPYATYKFRILIEITSTSYISTPETEPITTLPKGAPSAPPTILEILAPTPSVISVTWAPPIFVNGPLLGYRLHLQPVNHTDLHSTMREVQGNVTSWTFRQLQPSQYYVLSVSAWNRDGEGGADTASVITPNPGNLSTEEMPFLILGEDNKVLKHQLTDLFTTPYPLQKIEPRTSMVRGAEILYESSNSVNMSGIGLHIRRQILLVSDSGNNVWLVDVTQKNAQRRTCSNLQEPSAVTVDWLNDVAYIVDGNYIYRCDFDKDKVMPAAGPLPTVPKEIKVDPLSGFIYFTQSDQNVGIFRIDIGLIQPNYTVPYSQVIKSHLNTFSIDHNNLQLYFPNETQNTMMSSFLDGTGTIDLRKNKVIRPNYYGIVSMVYYNGLFYWTTGTDVLKEDYDKSNDTFYLNPMLFFNHHYVAFNIYQQSVQPKPVPHSPPQRLQALFVANKVYIQWQAPRILTFQGIGAWKKWQYDVFISEKDGSSTQIIEKVDVTYSEVLNLVQDTSYIVKVRARSEDKVGSWSSPFLGRTLTDDAAKARLVIASGFPRTLVTEVNMYREEVKTLTQMMFTDVQDMVWMKDLIVMATGNDLKLYNITSGYLMSLTLDALSVAYDWLGDKLYWSSAELGQIKRADLGQENSDFVTQGKARRMSIDAVAGRLYWATESSIESCFLNGEDHVKYFSLPYFSGKQVISMTLNFDQRKILWYVRGYDLQDLYMADLIQGTTNGEVPSFQRVGSFDSISDTSNLQYYSHRIFWQNKDGAVTVGDLDVNHTSVISPPGVSVFSVHHSTMQPYPAGFNRTTTKVIPNAITADSIICVGKWNKFNLTWSRSTVTHGDIRYEVSVVYNKKGHIVQTENNWYEMSGVLPYSLMKVTLRSHTYWGYSPATAVSVRSPMSVPSAPLTPRVYVTQHKNSAKSEKSLAADFRWSTPETSNGIIVRYIIHYRHLNNGQTTPLPPVSRHFIQNHLRPNVTYHFQVRACTDVGCGNFSDTVSARADAVNPVPKLLMATMDKVELAEVDSNSDASVAMVSNIKPKTLTFLAQDERLFWTDDSNHLYEGGKQGSGAASSTRLLSINGTVKDMNIDWISRTLYIVVHHNSGMTSTILAYLLDQRVHKIIKNRPVTITSIAVEPYTSTIFWTEYQAGTNKNKIYKLTNDNEAQLLFLMRKKRATSDACNCSSVQFGNVMTTDYSGNDEMGILIYDSQSNSMVATDASSCYCRIIVSQSPGFPPDLLAVDHLHIYWYNKQNNLLYIYDKVTKNIEQMSINGLQDMIAYGSHLQPLPSSECLDPGAYNKTISVTAVTNVTLSVQLDKVTWNKSCKGISRPATKYTVYIKEASKTGQTRCNLGNLDCTNKTSYERDIVLTGLKPYREYVVQAAVSNYYTEYLSEALSQPHMFKTAIGVPSAVKDVTLMVYTPYSLIVRWKQPLELNGPEDGLRYVIKYSTKINDVKFEGLVNSTKDSKRADACEVLEVEGICIKLENLVAGHLYEVKVLSSNMEELYYSESKTFFVTTYMTPSPLNVTGATHNSINVSWAIPEDNSTRAITYNFRKTTSTIWKQSWMEWNVPNKNVTVLNHTYSNLEPYTEYDMVIRINFQSGGNTDWPAGNPLTYRTLAYIPVAPEPPVIKELTSVSGHEIIWTPPRDNGEPIIFYTLQYFKEGQNQWLPAYNGSDPRWLVDQKIIPPDEVYFFRVAAMNAIGLSEFSANSSQFTYLSADDPGDINMAILASAFSVIFLLVVVAIMIACCVMRRRRFEKQKPTQFIAVARGPDMELATLRELPHTAIQQSNTLYAINIIPTDEDIAALPHFMRDQLTLTKFLGSGAFGEVFEGIARNILSDSSGETKVAVKTLRKSASDQEKEEFLKEALLMSNFKHQHILSLLGVCLNNDPQFIILELMEGGDLLSFLRGCRSSINHMYLSLADLIKICVHVARGCKYLEEMHFVHRDLAARNCLVSSKNPAELCVKIGDFGLARDIYKNDYYRKEGEGLLPVRWMSPESLVDGVFTTRSDIWAFGVLMWEVLTFGQQPYPARTNLEVLHFVRSGGQLDKPDNCPQDTFYLMKKCWSADIEDRPSFSHILQTLEEFHQKCIALQSEYIMPIHSNRPQETSEADGFERGQRVKRKKREKQRTSSLGHDSIQRDPASLYRRIHRSTSFDSPEPREVKCEYLSPKTSGVPTYLELISDPSDPPPPETFIHKSRSRKLSSQNSRHASVSSRNTSVSSRHSSCSSDTFCHPMESRLTVNLPASSNEDTGCYKHVHSIDSVSGSEFPYASVSRSIPEERDEVFEESDKCFKLPEGYDFVPAPLRNMRSPSEGSRNVRHLSDIDQRMRNPSDSSQRSTPMIDMPEGYTFVPAQYGNKVSNTILPEGYDYVPPTLHSNSNLNYLNGYSVIKSPQKQVHTAGTREAGYMVVKTPAKSDLLSASSSDDVKMSQISLFSPEEDKSASDTQQDKSSYVSYDPACIPTHGNIQKVENNYGISNSAEMYIKYDNEAIYCERPYNSAEARLVFTSQKEREKNMLNNNKQFSRNLAINDANYVDCNTSKSYLSLSSMSRDSLMEEPVKYIVTNNNVHLPTVHSDLDNRKVFKASKCQVYPVDKTSPRQGYPCNDDVIQFASLV